jgi:hypothetical protein
MRRDGSLDENPVIKYLIGRLILIRFGGIKTADSATTINVIAVVPPQI